MVKFHTTGDLSSILCIIPQHFGNNEAEDQLQKVVYLLDELPWKPSKRFNINFKIHVNIIEVNTETLYLNLCILWKKLLKELPEEFLENTIFPLTF